VERVPEHTCSTPADRMSWKTLRARSRVREMLQRSLSSLGSTMKVIQDSEVSRITTSRKRCEKEIEHIFSCTRAYHLRSYNTHFHNQTRHIPIVAFSVFTVRFRMCEGSGDGIQTMM